VYGNAPGGLCLEKVYPRRFSAFVKHLFYFWGLRHRRGDQSGKARGGGAGGGKRRMMNTCVFGCVIKVLGGTQKNMKHASS